MQVALERAGLHGDQKNRAKIKLESLILAQSER